MFPAMASLSPAVYWRVTKRPRYDLVFALPLLVAYELLAFSLSHDAIAGVRNGADVILKSAFLAMGGRWGLVVFGIILVGGGAFRVILDIKANGRPRGTVYLGMAGESIGYALVFGGVTSILTALALGQWSPLAVAGFDGFDLPTQLMISLGAGLYEELLFRVLLVGGLAALGRRVFKWSAIWSGVFAVLVGALIFSLFHYIGPYGDPFQIPSFTFRAIAGVLFSGLYLLRGFGITAWTHALYDVLLAVSGV
jgi:membrane protease YdiL (CAAX protease family)